MIDPDQWRNPLSGEAHRVPRLLGVSDLTPAAGEAGRYQFSLPPATDGEFTLLVECIAQGFPLERFCRFVRHPEENRPYTFSSLEFHESPPGIRIGPWPGWRGIPDFPVMLASCGPVEIKLQPTFWGDEITCGLVRMLGRFPIRPDGVVTLVIADPQIIPRRVSIYRTQALKASQHAAGLLPELIGVHPRLLVTPKQLPHLRARKVGSHRMLWRRLESLRNNWQLPFEKSAESKCVPGPERLSGEDRVLVSALIALITEQQNDVQQALEAYSAYVDQTGSPDFEPLGIDTQAGEVLFILSVGYDWLFSRMSRAEREVAWEQIERVASICALYLTSERRDYGQAHYLGCGLGLLAYCFLVPDGAPDAPARAAELRGALDCALELLSDDGSYPHGINLWIYEFGFLLRWIEVIRVCSGEDLWIPKGHALECASAFRIATLSGDARQAITFGDPQYRVGGDSWCHFLIAARTGSGTAQWLGERLLDLPHEGVDFRNVPARRRVYEFLFYDPAVTPTPPGAGVQCFAELGQVTVRSSRTLFTMRSGPPLGRLRYAAGEYGAYGHSEPASGSFLIEHDGRFIASGPGPVYRRDSALHNVVTIDGQGQVGDSTVWLPDFFPPEVLPPTLSQNPDGSCATLAADLSNAYLPHLGVERYLRSVYVDPERVVLGVDITACKTVQTIEWNVHSRFPFRHMPETGLVAFDLGGDARLVLLSPMDASWRTGLMEFIPAYPNDGTRDYQCVVNVKAGEARFIWCYLLASQALPRLRNRENGAFTVECEGGLTFTFDGRRFLSRGQP